MAIIPANISITINLDTSDLDDALEKIRSIWSIVYPDLPEIEQLYEGSDFASAVPPFAFREDSETRRIAMEDAEFARKIDRLAKDPFTPRSDGVDFSPDGDS